LIDKSGQFGTGGEGVYDHSEMLFMLNQPVYRMGIPFPRSLEFWLSARQNAKDENQIKEAQEFIEDSLNQGLTLDHIRLFFPEAYLMGSHFGPHDYIPRALYGDYLKDMVQQIELRIDAINMRYGMVQDGHKLITLEKIQVEVTNLTPNEQGLFLLDGTQPTAEGSEKSTMTWQSGIGYDTISVATGHEQNNILEQFQGHKGYGDTPFRIQEITAVVEEARKTGDPIFCAGTGQAFMDFLGVVNALDFKGRIIAASGDLIEPWPRNHQRTPTPRIDHGFCHFTIESVQTILVNHDDDKIRIIAELKKLIQAEMHCEVALTTDPQNVIATFSHCKDTLFKPLFEGQHDDIYEEICAFFKDQDGNSTVPDRYETYRKFRENILSDGKPQLELVQGRVDNQKSHILDNGNMLIVVKNKDGDEIKIETSAVINTASILRVPFDPRGNPVEKISADLVAEGLAVADLKSRTLKPSAAFSERIEFLGAGRGGGFGVPVIHRNCQDAGKELAHAALDRARKRLSGHGLNRT
jgi:hypothetical protein